MPRFVMVARARTVRYDLLPITTRAALALSSANEKVVFEFGVFLIKPYLTTPSVDCRLV